MKKIDEEMEFYKAGKSKSGQGRARRRTSLDRRPGARQEGKQATIEKSHRRTTRRKSPR